MGKPRQLRSSQHDDQTLNLSEAFFPITLNVVATSPLELVVSIPTNIHPTHHPHPGNPIHQYQNTAHYLLSPVLTTNPTNIHPHSTSPFSSLDLPHPLPKPPTSILPATHIPVLKYHILPSPAPDIALHRPHLRHAHTYSKCKKGFKKGRVGQKERKNGREGVWLGKWKGRRSCYRAINEELPTSKLIGRFSELYRHR